MWRTIAPHHRHLGSDARLCAGCEIRTRGERKRAPARQPTEQKLQPQTTRRETIRDCDTDYHCVHWLRWLRSSKSACKAQRGQNSNARWRICVPAVSLASDDVLTSTICSTRDGFDQLAMSRTRRESAFRRGGLASQCNRIISLHHTTKHEIEVYKSV